MKARYPSLVRSALPPRHSYPRPVIMAPQIEVEIPVHWETSMPLALDIRFTIGSQTDTKTYRTNGGHLYVRSGFSAESLFRALEDPFDPHGPFAFHILEIGKHMRMLDRRSKPWPTGVGSHLTGYRRNTEIRDRILDQSDKVFRYREEEFETELEFWKQSFLRQVSLYALLDGEVWVRAPEPTLQVSIGSAVRLQADLTNAFDSVEGMEYDQPYRHAAHFPVYEDMEARQFAETVSGGSFFGDKALEITIHSPRAFTLDVYGHSLAAAGGNLLKDTYAMEEKCRDADLMSARRELSHRLSDWRRDSDGDAVAFAISAVVEAIRNLGLLDRRDMVERLDVETYEWHLRKWEDRTVAPAVYGMRSRVMP